MCKPVILGAAVSLALLPNVARCDSNSLQPVAFATLQSDLKQAFAKIGLKDPLTSAGCLPGGPAKRQVCTFKLGTFMQVLAESKPGEQDVVGITFICAPKDPADATKCLLADAGAISLADPKLAADGRGRLLSALMAGLDSGNEISIKTDERKYILQKSLGLWLHVMAADASD